MLKGYLQQLNLAKLLADELLHFIVSVGAGLLIFYLFRDVRLCVIGVLLCLLVDVDHLADVLWSFFITKRHWVKLLIPFHALEFLPIGLLLFVFIKVSLFGVITISLSFHYLVDFLTNRHMSPYGYFLFFRVTRRFNRLNIYSAPSKNVVNVS